MESSNSNSFSLTPENIETLKGNIKLIDNDMPFIHSNITPQINTVNPYNIIPTGKFTMNKILDQLTEANNLNKELQDRVKELSNPHTLKDILLVLLGAGAGVILTVIAVKLGFL